MIFMEDGLASAHDGTLEALMDGFTSSSSQFSSLGKISYGRVKGNPRRDPDHLPKFPRIQSAVQLLDRSRQSPNTPLTHQLFHPKPRVIRNVTLAVLCRRSP